MQLPRTAPCFPGRHAVHAPLPGVRRTRLSPCMAHSAAPDTSPVASCGHTDRRNVLLAGGLALTLTASPAWAMRCSMEGGRIATVATLILGSEESPSSNKATVETAYKAIFAKDFAAFEALCSPDFKYIFGLPKLPGFQSEYTASEMGAFADKLFATFDIIKFDPTEQVEDGNTVAAFIKWGGKARTTNKSMYSEFVQTWSFGADGKITKLEDTMDSGLWYAIAS